MKGGMLYSLVACAILTNVSDRFNIVFARIINHEIEQVTFRLEMPQYQNVSFWTNKIFHEKANLPLQETMCFPLDWDESLDVIGDVKCDAE